MNKFLLTGFFILAGLLLAAPFADADQQVYRWVDKDGVVHYGDRVPDGVSASPVSVKPNTVASVQSQNPAVASPSGSEAAVEADEALQLSVAEQRRQARAEQRKESAEEQRLKEANCKTMRNQKAFVEPSPRVLVNDGNGGVRQLDDNERMEMLKEANDYLAANCN